MYIQKTAEKKGKSVFTWWDDLLLMISKCRLASHVGKFTHPDIKVSLWNEAIAEASEYISSASVQTEPDILTPAQYLGAASFLLQPVTEEGQTVLEDLEAGGKMTAQELDTLQLDVEPLIQAVKEMKIRSREAPFATDERMKQVYFPIGPDEYHLLSLMTAPGLMAEIKRRIREMSEQRRSSYDPKSSTYQNDCREVKNLTVVGFGGTKPQNISVLNSRQGGKFYLIPSLPPVWKEKEIYLPRKDFFMENLYYRRYTDIFLSLHQLFMQDRSNMEIRRRIHEKMADLADIAIGEAWKVRSCPNGWSQMTSLPDSQKIWLDAAMADRSNHTQWIADIGQAFGRWFITSYERIKGKQAVILGDGELRSFARQLEEIIQREVHGI